MLVDMYGEHLGFNEAEKMEIGYIGYSNKKFKIKTNDDLQRAFESGELHKNEIAVFYICRKQELPKMSGVVSTTLLLHVVDILSSLFAFVPLIISTFSLEKTAPAQVSPDDSETDLDNSSKNKRPQKQSKGKSLEKTIERLHSIHIDKWGLGEYRL